MQFNEMVASATVGLQVRQFNPASLPAAIRPNDQTSFLDAAALITLADRCQRGIKPDSWETVTPPTLSSGVQTTGAALGALRQLLAERPGVSAAALQILIDHQREIPIKMLPELAGQALAPGSVLRELVAAVAGETGRWLLHENPAWQVLLKYAPSVPAAKFGQTVPEAELATSESADDIWLHGTLAERVDWLGALRTTQPDYARKLLEEIWPKSKVAERVELLQTLENGLSVADDDFLERARADKSDKVLTTALKLSSQLSQGTFVEQRATLMRTHFTVQKKLFRKLVTTELPADRSHGIIAGAEHSLSSFVAYTPLHLWKAILGVEPSGLGELSRDGVEWYPNPAFIQAALIQGDQELLSRLLLTTKPPDKELLSQWLGTDSIALIDDSTRLTIIRRELTSNPSKSSLNSATRWLGNTLPTAILDDFVQMIITKVPELLGHAELVLALARCTGDHLSKLRHLTDELGENYANELGVNFAKNAQRNLGQLTLLARLNQELS